MNAHSAVVFYDVVLFQIFSQLDESRQFSSEQQDEQSSAERGRQRHFWNRLASSGSTRAERCSRGIASNQGRTETRSSNSNLSRSSDTDSRHSCHFLVRRSRQGSIHHDRKGKPRWNETTETVDTIVDNTQTSRHNHDDTEDNNHGNTESNHFDDNNYNHTSEKTSAIKLPRSTKVITRLRDWSSGLELLVLLGLCFQRNKRSFVTAV